MAWRVRFVALALPLLVAAAGAGRQPTPSPAAFPSDAEVRTMLAPRLDTGDGKAGVNIKTLKDRIRAQLVWQATVQKKFRRDIQIADADVDEALASSAAGGGAAAEGGAAPAAAPGLDLCGRWVTRQRYAKALLTTAVNTAYDLRRSVGTRRQSCVQ